MNQAGLEERHRHSEAIRGNSRCYLSRWLESHITTVGLTNIFDRLSRNLDTLPQYEHQCIAQPMYKSDEPDASLGVKVDA